MIATDLVDVALSSFLILGIFLVLKAYDVRASFELCYKSCHEHLANDFDHIINMTSQLKITYPY